MGRLLQGVSPSDPPTYATVAALLALSGLIAAWVPARRATHVDPMLALRADYSRIAQGGTPECRCEFETP